MPIYVFGAGGHAKVVISTLLATGRKVVGIFDDDPQKRGSDVFGIPVLGPIIKARDMPPALGVIAVGDNHLRARIAREFPEWQWIVAIHPRAYVAFPEALGPGTVVFAGAVVQPGARLGAHVIINTGATVDHDCYIEDFAHIAPGVNLGGGVWVGEGALIGIGAVIVPGIRIGAWSVVGAGAAVIRDVAPGSTVVGVPARPVKKKEDHDRENTNVCSGH